MADYVSPTEARRPTVVVVTARAQDIDLQPIFWGLEEEGIPVEVQEVSSGEAIALAKEAAHMSPLNVGIGVDGVQGTLALHHRDLPADNPLFVLKIHEVRGKDLRKLGVNAARLVKSEPLLLADAPADPSPQSRSNPPEAEPSDQLVQEIVSRIFAELAKA